jgi:hypothetical protein
MEGCLVLGDLNTEKQCPHIPMFFVAVDPGVKCVKYNEFKTFLDVL